MIRARYKILWDEFGGSRFVSAHSGLANCKQNNNKYMAYTPRISESDAQSRVLTEIQ